MQNLYLVCNITSVCILRYSTVLTSLGWNRGMGEVWERETVCGKEIFKWNT